MLRYLCTGVPVRSHTTISCCPSQTRFKLWFIIQVHYSERVSCFDNHTHMSVVCRLFPLASTRSSSSHPVRTWQQAEWNTQCKAQGPVVCTLRCWFFLHPQPGEIKFSLKGRYKFGNCQRPVFSLGVSLSKTSVLTWRISP